MAFNIALTGGTFGVGKFDQARTAGYGPASATPFVGSRAAATLIDFTVECFFQASTGGKYIFNQPGGMSLFIGTLGEVRISYNLENIDFFTPGFSETLLNGAWHHLAVVTRAADGGEAVAIFVDGVKKYTNIHSQFWGQADFGANPFLFGAQDSAGLNAFVGGIDELIITNGAKYTVDFTPATAQLPNNTAGLRALYHFNGNGLDLAGLAEEATLTAPGAPTAVAATVGTAVGTASVAFTAPTANGGSAITGYTVTASTGQKATGTSSPIVVTGLAAVATTFTATATNSIGTSVASTVSNSITPAADTAKPTLVSAVATNGKTIVLTFSETLAAFTPTPADFTFSGAQAEAIARNDATITLSGFTPEYAFGNTITATYARPATNGLRDASGNLVDSFGPVAVTNNIPNRTALAGYTLKLFGNDVSHDFSTEAALNTYINGLTLNNTTGPVMIYCHKDIDFSGRQWGPASSDGTNFVTLRPAPGLGYNDIELDTAPLQYGTVGLEMLVTTNSRVRMGMEITGWRVRQTATAAQASGVMAFRRDTFGQAGQVNAFHHNRILIQHVSKGFESGEFSGNVTDHDNLYLVDAANTQFVMTGGFHHRNTYVRLNGAVGVSAIDNAADNCVFAGCGGNPMGGNGAGNFTNTTQSVQRLGLTTVSTAFFVSATNYRPATGSPMIGGATAAAVSTNDNNGNNRGLAPDSGAAQLTPAQPLPTGTITEQAPIDGQTLTITLSTTNTPTSGKISLTPANPANGASSIGPLSLVLGVNVASITIDDISAGNYLAPTVTLTNAGGTVSVAGTAAFEVMGVGSLVYDTGGVGGAVKATTLVLSGPSSGTVNAAQFITVSTDNPLTGNETQTVTLSSPNGTFAPASLTLTSATLSASSQYTPTLAGAHTLTASATGTPVISSATKSFTANAIVVTPPPPPPVRTVTLTLKNRAGAPRASLTGLRWAFFEAVTPDRLAAPVSQGIDAKTSLTGAITLTVQTTLAAGATGWLVLSDSTGNPATASNAFSAPVTVS